MSFKYGRKNLPPLQFPRQGTLQPEKEILPCSQTYLIMQTHQIPTSNIHPPSSSDSAPTTSQTREDGRLSTSEQTEPDTSFGENEFGLDRCSFLQMMVYHDLIHFTIEFPNFVSISPAQHPLPSSLYHSIRN